MSGNGTAVVPVKGLRVILRTLKYRNYRLFFIGQAISLIGTWMQQVAMGWLVYRMTNSALLLGVIGFMGVPTFILTPFAGVLVDRWDRRRILLATQTLFMLQAFALAGLVLSGLVAPWHLVALALVNGLINAVDVPTRQAFFVVLIEDKKDLGNAIALNSSIFNVARMVGPTLAGVLLAVTNEGVCFLVNALSFLAVLAALLAITVPPQEKKAASRRVLQELGEGARYVFGSRPMRSILILVSLTSLLGMPYAVLMPVFAKTIFQGGPHVLGFLMTASGTGALAGAIHLASRENLRGLARWIVISSLLFGTCLLAFSFSRILWLSLCLLVPAGFGIMGMVASCNTILQTLVEDDKRGRLMSFYAMAFMGAMPFGALIAGALANRIGAPYTVTIGALVSLAAGIWFATNLPALRRSIRENYREKGLAEVPPTPPGAAV